MNVNSEDINSIIPTNVNTAVKKLILPKGKWIVKGILQFDYNTVGVRIIGFNFDTSGTKYGDTNMACTGSYTCCHTLDLFNIDGNRDIYLMGYQSSGDDLKVVYSSLEVMAIG